HLFLPEARALPAIVVVRQPNGSAHFVVAWRRHGRFVQLMDPASGRRWSSCRRFMREVYTHDFTLPAGYWREYAASEEFLGALHRRLTQLGLAAKAIARLTEVALMDSSWRTFAALDAATRMVDAVVRYGGLPGSGAAERVVESFFDRARAEPAAQPKIIPDRYWSVQAADPAAGGEEQVRIRGAVLVRVLGRRATNEEVSGAEREPLSPELVAALAEKQSRPGAELLRLFRADGLLSPGFLIAALALAAVGVVCEAIVFRALFDLGRDLNLTGQRFAAIGALLLFLIALLLLELPIAAGLLRAGRRLEVRLRVAFLEKIPRLIDRYFQSRLTADMAERSHSVHTLRLLPELGGQFLRFGFELVLTTAGIIWLDPASAPLVLFAAAFSLGLPLFANPLLTERDLRIRTHTGALSRFYLDALLGLVAVRAHGAERALRSEHENLLVEWARASFNLQRTAIGLETVQSFVGFGLAAWLLFAHLGRAGDAGAVLLLVYWALNLPVLGQEIAVLARQYPEQRNRTLRLLEPLGAPERVEVSDSASPCSDVKSSAVAIAIETVCVRAAGHTILEDVDFAIEAGNHVAIIGPSGAGKSSLAGLLLGWHRPASGRVLIDGLALDAQQLDQLRRETA
ncbi:MAG: ATP-binding cassette domain-containing protein, partial [Verrucomicrobiota bacterium]|nr:ATP-binding cassette domain-containing protein [Verrucomicrobiota bacterium]